jgi:hypothetical protein
MRAQRVVIKKKAEAAQRSGESLRPGHAVLGPVLFGRLTACDRPQTVYLTLMEPLHYDDLPKTSAECWELLSESDRRAAVKAFLVHGEEREDEDLPDFKKAVLKLSGIAEIVKLFDGWPMERRIAKSLQTLDRDKMKNHWGSLVRYWLLVEHRPLIRATLDAAGIPNDKGYIADDYEGVTVDMWKKGLAVLWQHDELPARLYLGYVLKDTRQGKPAGIWDKLAEALGKGTDRPSKDTKPAEVAVVPDDHSVQVEVVDQAKVARAEESGEFLLYEQEIIKALARGAISRTDAVEAEDAVEMARQVIDDAPGRARVFFLLGFAQALHRRKPDLSGVNGINPERISWFFGGYVHGLARQTDSKAIVAFIKETPDMFTVFLEKPEHPAFAQTHGFISKALSDAEEAGMFRELISSGVYVFGEVDNFTLLLQGSAMARELTSKRNYDEVLKLCSTLKSLADRLAKSEMPFFARFAAKNMKQLRRREAIAMLGKGDQEGARAAFGQLAAEGNSREKVEARAWIAMAKAGLTDFFAVFPSATQEQFEKSGERMQAVLREITDQKMEASKLSPTVGACAGMAEYCHGNYPAALAHFRNAAEALMQEGRPTTSRAYLWLRFMRSSSQLMSMDFSSPEVIVDDFEVVAGSKITPASWFYAALVESAALFPDQRLLPLVLAAVPDEDGEKHFKAYQSADILPQNAQKRVAYAQWLPGSKRKKKDVFDQLCQVVRWDIKAGKLEAAEIAIDGLEQLAEESDEFATDLLNLVSEKGVVPDIMEEATQLELRIRLLLRLKRDTDAVQLMLERFRKAATSSNAWHREQSLELLAELKATEADLSQVSVIAAKLAAEFDSNNTGNDIIATAGKVRVIYVGGNEIQQRYEKDIVAELAVEHPNLSVDFEYPGWSSNWASVADGIKSRLGDYDGLVLSYFVRTIFGRTIRKMCTDTCPWWAAPGHGKASIKRGILAAARHAASRRPKAKA